MSGIESLYALADVVAGKPSPMMLFAIGDYRSEKYPKLSLPQELADAVIANFESDVLHRRVPVESVGSHDATSPAGGWIDRVYMAPFEWQGLSGDALYADWTPNERGAQIVNDGEYAYNSVELDSFIDPVTGDKSVNVLKAVALTNRPVLSFMPSVKDAGDAIKLAEPVEIALSEITLAPIPDFIIEAMRKKWRKANPDKDDSEMPANIRPEDSGTTAASEASSEPVPDAGKGDEGQTVTLADGSAEQRGSESMKTVALKLNLSEDADESTILAEVARLEESRDAEKKRADDATAKLDEAAKATRVAAVDATLSALIEGGHLLPGQKDEMLALAESSPDGFDRAAVILKTSKAIVLGETGSGKAGDESVYANASVELAEKAKARKAADGITFAAAQTLVLSEDTDLAARYDEFRTGKE